MSNKSTTTVATMGIDIGKNSFHVVGLDERGAIVVCTENSVPVDLVAESPNVSDDGRAVMLLAGVVCLAVQVEGPT